MQTIAEFDQRAR